MKKNKKWYIKERHNPQTGIYYVLYGQMSAAEAATKVQAIYGTNYMLKYDTEEEYSAAIAKLKAEKKKNILPYLG